MMSPNKVYPEVSTWSVTWGLVMVVLFSAAAAYLGLKVGQVFEAAIPIAIIAIGMSSATKRKNALGENVIIQSIGACSGAVGCRRYLRNTCHLYARFTSWLLSNIHCSSIRWHFRNTLLNTLPQVFC